VARRKWAPRLREPFVGTVFRYIPHGGDDPMDGTYSMKEGKRWNAKGSFPVVYTNCSLEVAIANLWHQFEDEAGAPWDVAEEKQADLFEIPLSQPGLIDVVSPEGIAGIGLPATYPMGVSWRTTQRIGARLHGERRPGIWCKAAAHPAGEEIALFTDFCETATPRRPAQRLWEWFPVPEEWKSA